MLIHLAGAGLVASIVGMTILWLISLRLRDASIVDIFWGANIAILSLLYLALSSPRTAHGHLTASLVLLWGIRLSVYIGSRNTKKGEDFRYANWRRKYGAQWKLRSLFQVFLLQGLIAWVISMPVLASQAHEGRSIGILGWIGFLIWVIGFSFEAISDYQLMKFKSAPENAGKTLTTGLWAYSRHPNYFGEMLLWWGIFLIAVEVGGLWSFFGPLLLSWLLLKVSGVPMLEESLAKRSVDYAQYVRTTNAFFPGPKKSPGGHSKSK